MNRSVSKNVRVCLIEDNDDYRASVAKVARRVAGPDGVQAFADCEQALEELGDGHPPDVILLDIGLPGISGLEGIRRLKKLAPGVRIIMLTSFDDHARVFEAICAGASGYLLKTSPVAELSDAITLAMDGGAPMSPSIARAVLEQFARLSVPKMDDSLLSPREREVLELMARGRIMKEIATDLSLSYHTVDAHIRSIYEKLHVHTRAGAVAKAYKDRLI